MPRRSALCTYPSFRLTRASSQVPLGPPQHGSQEVLPVSTVSVVIHSGRECFVQIRDFLGTPPRPALQCLASWSKSASSLSRHCLALGPLSYLCLMQQVARPQVQVALRLSSNSKVTLNSTVSSRLQLLRLAVLPRVLWPPRTPVSWQHTLLCGDNLDEPICTPCSLASVSTSHHELSALPETVLSPQDSAESQKNCQMIVCSTHHPVVRV